MIATSFRFSRYHPLLPHAVTSTSNGGSFSYDANGSMTSGFQVLWGLVRATGDQCPQCFSVLQWFGSTACNTETRTVTESTERVPGGQARLDRSARPVQSAIRRPSGQRLGGSKLALRREGVIYYWATI